ncbi:tRNA (guanine(10)-N2)-methyltransferase homolog [Neocloeon triangulifer]|uniref:tRNA (guanine(10)-N2)-methyltransferase homolog n=1 Tax=Neocloeon triangulifer TaxID=2078957 RepID=UPI00286FAC67|nr:tRNA (guanine(10)-N2)-methyltransferase homolog [Neocloeon triangulifer]
MCANVNTADAINNTMAESVPTRVSYLLWFAQEHVNFRAADVESVASIFGIKINYKTQISEYPYCIVDLPSEEEAKLLASRCISVKSILELWGHGKTVEELHENVKKLPETLTSPYFGADKTFRLVVETFCKSISQKEKVERIESFGYLPIEGDVNLKNPDVVYYLLEYFGQDSNNIPEKPYELFFGRRVADGQRALITKLSLKTRHFLGNTSMDAQLSLLMANQAKIVPGSLVYDPFVGSGSLLVSAAQFGGYVCGADLDFLMIHGKTRPVRPNQKVREKGESIKSNMRQYNLSSRYLDVLVADFARPLWRPDVRFDAILTDPPYGVRESTAKVGSWRGADIKPILEKHLPHHIPAKVDYDIQELMRDLLDFSANYLCMGGRLVFWLPICREEYDEEKSLPKHECLKLVSNCEQVLSCHSSRLLLCMEKVEEPLIKEKTPPAQLTSTTKFRDRYFSGRPLNNVDLTE